MPLRAASEYLIANGIGTHATVEAVRGFLSSGKTTNVFVAATLAKHLSCDELDVERVLDGYAEHGVLQPEQMISCSKCDTLAVEDDVRQAQEAGDDYPCPGGCHQDLVADDEAEPVTVYRLIDTPAS